MIEEEPGLPCFRFIALSSVLIVGANSDGMVKAGTSFENTSSVSNAACKDSNPL
jgi:hypothetical protein